MGYLISLTTCCCFVFAFMPKLTFSDFLSGIRAKSLEEWLIIGKNFASLCSNNISIALVGDLGTGKTSFVKGMALHWNINSIKSPTFNILDVHYGNITLLHIDAYRLKNTSNYESLALEDHLIPPFITLVEWPEFLPILNYNLTLNFEVEQNNTFIVKLSNFEKN